MKSQKSITPFKNMYPIITGGSVVTIGSYKIHTFTSSGTFTVVRGGKIEFLLVAGGGGGGSADLAYGGGGGGAGGLIHTTSYNITIGTKSYTIGAGGAGSVRNSGNIGTNGGNSIFDTYTAIGGGAGGYSSGVNVIQPNIGGSGGGSSRLGAGGANGTTGQGNKGGDWSGGTPSGAGGGGATGIGQTDYVSGAGSIGGAGGTGYIFEGTEYAKGGMGGTQNFPISGPTTPNTGNGGDASYETWLENGNNGADGVFIIKYRYK